jgi:hypothetical protein
LPNLEISATAADVRCIHLVMLETLAHPGNLKSLATCCSYPPLMLVPLGEEALVVAPLVHTRLLVVHQWVAHVELSFVPYRLTSQTGASAARHGNLESSGEWHGELIRTVTCSMLQRYTLQQ